MEAAERAEGPGCIESAAACLRFVTLPPPTTADVDALAETVAQRLAGRLAAAAEEQRDYLDPGTGRGDPRSDRFRERRRNPARRLWTRTIRHRRTFPPARPEQEEDGVSSCPLEA